MRECERERVGEPLCTFNGLQKEPLARLKSTPSVMLMALAFIGAIFTIEV